MDKLIKDIITQLRNEGTAGTGHSRSPLSPEDQKLSKDIEQIWEWSGQYPSQKPHFDSAKNFKALKERIAEDKAKRSGPIIRPLRLLSIAATLAFLLAGTWLVWSILSPAPAYEIAFNSSDQQLELNLADGSIVQLFPQAKLEYPSAFKQGNSREVKLSGMALFNIQKRTGQDFIVQTANTKVKVLGTRFLLQESEKEKQTTISVTEGKVEFTDKSTGKQVYVNSNNMGICKAGGILYEQALDKNEEVSFPRQLKCQNGSLTNFTDWFVLNTGWKVSLDTSSENCKISGNFDAQKPSKSLAYIKALGYKIDTLEEQHYIISGNCD